MIKFIIDKNDKHNDKHMVTNWGCNYTEMVILTCSFCLFKLAFNHMMWSMSKLGFSSKDCLPSALKSFVVYKFVCAGCQSCYIGETKRHLPTRINEHLLTDKKSNIFKHLLENAAGKNVCDENYRFCIFFF